MSTASFLSARAGAAAGLAALLGARGLVPGLGGEAGRLPWLLADPACGAVAKDTLQARKAVPIVSSRDKETEW